MSEPDADELETLLGGCSSFDFDGALGLIHAVALAPGRVPPAAWLPLLATDGRGDVDRSRFLDLILRLYDDCLHGLDGGDSFFPEPDDEGACVSFSKGFVAGAELDDVWIGHDDHWSFAAPFAYLAGRRELVPAAFLQKLDAQPDARAMVCRKLGAVVLSAHESFSKVRDPAAPPREARAVRRVGRNDPCPCGSGKKFKRCCVDARADGDGG